MCVCDLNDFGYRLIYIFSLLLPCSILALYIHNSSGFDHATLIAQSFLTLLNFFTYSNKFPHLCVVIAAHEPDSLKTESCLVCSEPIFDYVVIVCFWFSQPIDRKKIYGGMNSGRPITPPRGGFQGNNKGKKK